MAGLTSILEPVMIVLMGAVVGSIVLAILLPMLSEHHSPLDWRNIP